jgi:hypothetical protein
LALAVGGWRFWVLIREFVANKAVGVGCWLLALNSVLIRAFVAKKAVGVGPP